MSIGTSNHGASNRNNSQHNTNRSALVSAVSSKQNGRMSIAYQGSSDFTTKNLSMSQVSQKQKKQEKENVSMRGSNS